MSDLDTLPRGAAAGAGAGEREFVLDVRTQDLEVNMGPQHPANAKPTPLANLHLTLLDKVGVRLDSFADSNGKADEAFEPVAI
jgi:hypothetical protein